MTALYLLYSLIILIILSVIILFFRKKTKNKFVNYDEAIKKIISLAPEINIVRISTSLNKERQSSYWRHIINRHFFSNYNTSEDYNYKHIKIKTFNEKQFGRISIKNLNSFINIMKEEAKKDL